MAEVSIDVSKMLKNVSKIKLKGGIFGKACLVLIIGCLTMGVISYFSNDIWVSRISIGIIPLIVLPVLWKLINLAEKMPQVALLEGAEFLVHQQMQMAAKGIPVLTDSLDKLIEETPIKIDKKLKPSNDKPDSEFGESEIVNE